MYKLIKDFYTKEEVGVSKSGYANFIPFDPANTDYQAYLAWLEEGNESIPAEETA
jgi:hypothetical protein